jgi:predicted HicB family RNase H-like nuclease
LSQTIQISERSAYLLNQQATARGKSLEEWVEELAIEHGQANITALD